MSYEEPFKPLLDRDISVVAAKSQSDPSCTVLREVINYSTWAFQRCQTERNLNAQDVDLSILMQYLHIIEMSDGIEVLLSKSCVNPVTPLLRTCFEALLGIEYILAGDYESRALSWMVVYTHNRLRMYENYSSNSARGQTFRAAISSDITEQDAFLTPDIVAIADQQLVNLPGLFNRPQYQPIEAEYQRIANPPGNRNPRNPNWYSLFQGPANLRKLAEYLDKQTRLHQPEDYSRTALYIQLYSNWSEVMHANDLSRHLTYPLKKSG